MLLTLIPCTVVWILGLELHSLVMDAISTTQLDICGQS